MTEDEPNSSDSTPRPEDKQAPTQSNRFVWEPGDVEIIRPDDPRVQHLLTRANRTKMSNPSVTQSSDLSAVDLPDIAIERIYERDVDLLLAEELSVSPDFAAWVVEKINLGETATLELKAVQVSQFNKDGESDLIAIYADQTANERLALMIEDKIDAPFQPNQAARYRIRGQTGIDRGEWNRFETLLCAPSGYLQKHAEALKDFDRALSFEDIQTFLSARDRDRRSLLRARILEIAIPKGSSAYVRQQDATTDAFWDAMHHLAQTEYRELELRKGPIASGGTWRVMHPADLPKSVTINVKGSLGHVDLSFQGPSFDEVSAIARRILLNDATIHQTGSAISIRLLVEKFKVTADLDEAMPKVRAAFATAKRLLDWFREHRRDLEPLFRLP